MTSGEEECVELKQDASKSHTSLKTGKQRVSAVTDPWDGGPTESSRDQKGRFLLREQELVVGPPKSLSVASSSDEE